MKYLLVLLIAFPCFVQAQAGFGNQRILDELSKFTASFPAGINDAWQQFGVQRPAAFDSLRKMLDNEYKVLADKMDRRSAILNAYAGYDNPNAVRHIIPTDFKMNDYFIREQDKMDVLERAFNQSVKTYYGKEDYKTKGYIGAWDSVYRSRLPALKKYRDGVIKLVKGEIDYLKANEGKLKSKDEAERMQYVEKHLSVLGRLDLLYQKINRVVLEEGAKKVEDCTRRPELCK